MALSVPADASLILRLRLRIRRYRARTQGYLGMLRFLTYALLGRVHEVWIGDSNAVHLNSATMITAMRRLPEGRWVVHLGPRVMYSIAKEGLPAPLLRMLRWTRRTPRAHHITWGFSFGEIDVRCHLAPRMSDPDAALAFVPVYLEHVRQAVRSSGARRGLVLAPTPPSATYPEQAGFPVVGTFVERVDATTALRDAMVKALAELPTEGPSIVLVDLIDDLADAKGGMREELTFDGLHTNEAGRAVFRHAVDEILAETAVK